MIRDAVEEMVNRSGRSLRCVDVRVARPTVSGGSLFHHAILGRAPLRDVFFNAEHASRWPTSAQWTGFSGASSLRHDASCEFEWVLHSRTRRENASRNFGGPEPRPLSSFPGPDRRRPAGRALGI